MFNSKHLIYSHIFAALNFLITGGLHAANPALLVPKEVVFLLIIPELSTETAVNLSMTCKDFNNMLFSDHKDKMLLLSRSIPLEQDVHRQALIFYSRQFNNINENNARCNMQRLIETLIDQNNLGNYIRKEVLVAFNKNDSVQDTIELYGRDYAKNKFLPVNLSPKFLTQYDFYVLKLLCAQKFDANTQDSNGNTLLNLLTSDNNPTSIGYLLGNFRVDCNIQNNVGNTPLHCAISDSNLECITKLCLHPNLNLNIQNEDGNTPLHLLAMDYDTKCMELFFKLRPCNLLSKALHFSATRDINPNIKNNDGYTPLLLAGEFGNISAAELLLENPLLDPNIKDKYGDTAVHLAIKNYQTAYLKLLLENPATNPNIKNKNGDTPSHWAVEHSDTELLELLLKNKTTDPNIKNKNEDTPLHWAIEKTDAEHLKLLLENPTTNPNIKNKDGNTPLHAALLWKDKIIHVRYLLENPKTNPNIKDIYGDTPFDYLISCEHLSVMEKIPYIEVFISNKKTKLSLLQKLCVYALRKTGDLDK